MKIKELDSESSDSELSDGDVELQEAFAAGLIKPGLNTVSEEAQKRVNNIKGLKHKTTEIKLSLPWIELLDTVNKQAPLAPELAAKMLEQEHKRESQLKNNKKLPQFTTSDDPVINDFKREMMFHRQAQAAVMDAMPRLKEMGIPMIRPDDYFAEMAKTDAHMQKIRQHLMQKQEQQKQVERVKQLRAQKKEGKAMQIQTKLKRQQEKREMMNQVNRVRKGVSKDLSFLDGKGGKMQSKRAIEKKKVKDKKFGFGGKKKGSKVNTKDSAADISEFKRPKPGGSKLGRKGLKAMNKNQRPGKNKRVQNKARGRK